VPIPAGTFTIGNNSTGDGTEHAVNVSAFSIGKTDVTYAEWNSVKIWADAHGYQFDNGGTGTGDNYPVTNVNWYDVVKWINAKSEMQGLLPVYYTNSSFLTNWVYRSGRVNLSNAMVNWTANGYRLPTEAEWEKAARGGLAGKLYPNGDTLTSNDANFGSSVVGTTPVRSYPPNGYGLYDMAGNVWQWCWDWSGDYIGGSDPMGPDNGSFRVMRGGSWRNPQDYSRVSWRHSLYATYNYDCCGFRLVRRP
jgi:sulfatase modifying factor 1